MKNLESRTKKLLLLGAAAALIVLAGGVGLGQVLAIMSAAPEVDREYSALETTVVYSRDGELLAGIYEEDRTYVELERIPQQLQDAFIAVEDRNFYSHPGVDPRAIARALYANLRHGEIVEGGSTITQQLARNLYLDAERTMTRKLKEIRIALDLEQSFTKDEILEMYLNHIYLGSGAYGVQAASQRYFDKDVEELRLDEMAVLAALPRAPNYYSPLNNPEATEARRDIVLQRMEQTGYLSEDLARRTAGTPLETVDPEQETRAWYFVDHVRRKLLELFDEDEVFGEGLVVHTTLDIEAQAVAEEAFAEAVETGRIPNSENEDGDPQPQYAQVFLDVHTGAVRSMVGGRGDDEFNRAELALRHPGSAFKSFIYAAALSEGRFPGTVVNDIPRVADHESVANDDGPVVWPRNFDDQYRGLVNYRRALSRSINTAAVEVLRDIGIETARRHIAGYEFSSLTENDGVEDHYAFALGGLERGVSPLEMAAAYGAFAAGGVPPEPFAIEKVTDGEGRVLYRAPPREEPSGEELYERYIRRGVAPGYIEDFQVEPALSRENAFLMSDMLRTVVEQGTGIGARLEVPVAGKTGTSDDNADAWFVGYTQDMVMTVWIGEDASQPMQYTVNTSDIEITGVHASLIWGDIMRQLVDSDSDAGEAFERPPRVQNVSIDLFTGRPPGAHSAVAVDELMIDDEPDPIPIEIAIHMPAYLTLRRYLAGIPEHRPEPISEVELDPPRIDAVVFEPILPVYPIDRGQERQYLGSPEGPFGPVPLGPAEIELGGTEELKTADGEVFEGVYVIDRYEPVQAINPATGLPVGLPPGLSVN
ncbi:MAG: PBP1A family penicillin-binding protein [Spirochaetaceae bacterium]|nr:MAG: PBP1A family penicillin-binding protein [Spirochaetaceae bacterium]